MIKTQSDDATFPTKEEGDCSHGLTKREYFAAAAMQGILATGKDEAWQAQEVAEDATLHADRLIEALNDD